VDPTKPFLTEDLPEPILNLPWGTLFTIQLITKIKIQRPVVDRCKRSNNSHPESLTIWGQFKTK